MYLSTCVPIDMALLLFRYGLTKLIIKLMTDSSHNHVILEAVRLAVALLKGGHVETQVLGSNPSFNLFSFFASLLL